MILGFFNSADLIVNDNLIQNFLCEVSIPELRCFWIFQAAMENIHSETYSMLIQTYIKDDTERNNLYQALHKIPCIQKKANWAMKWTDKTKNSFAERIIAWTACEYILFSGSFCSIFWLKKRGLMPGLCFSNELISRDEATHCQFGIEMYKQLKNKLPESRVKEIIKEACENEKEFVSSALPVELIGMNSNLMKQYIEFCGDTLLICLGVSKNYNSENPFDWMDMISLSSKTNFFEKRVSDYSKSGVGDKNNFEFTMDVDF